MHILINSESSTGCLEDVLILRAGRDMGWSYFSSLTQLHTTNDLGSALIQRPLKWQQIFEICFSLASFVFLLGGFASQCYWGREKKKEVGRKRHFLVPTIWTQRSTVPTPARSIHQWTHEFCWHPISTDCTASDMGSITPRCHNLIVFFDLCT